MKKYILAGILLIAVVSCLTPEKFIVTNVGEEPESYTERLIYNLPRTVLMVKVNFENELYIPGPYRKYTEKYLGMNEFIGSKESKWAIRGAQISTYSEPDPRQFYSVNQISGPLKSSKYLELNRDGLIISPDKSIAAGSPSFRDTETPAPYFTDISVNEYIFENSDTLFKTIIRDTSFVRIPVITRQRQAKTIEQKAEEAANFIFNIRNRRFMIASGSGEEDEPVVFDGKAMEIAIKELNRLEKEYLSLFLGKVYTRKFSQTYFVTPSGSNESVTVARFSDTEGLLSADSLNGEPVSVELSLLGNTESLKKNVPQSPGNDIFNTYYYRIPEVVSIRLSYKDFLFYESRGSIFQAGTLMSLPVNAF